MEVLVEILGVALAAFCVWLTVRIVNRRERWAKCALAGTIIGVPALYVLSFGPACWWLTTPSRDSGDLNGVPIPQVQARRMYWPIGWLALNGPSSIERLLGRYARLGGHEVLVPTNAEETAWWLP